MIDFGVRPIFIEKKIFLILSLRLAHIPVSLSLVIAVFSFVSVLCSALSPSFVQALLEQAVMQLQFYFFLQFPHFSHVFFMLLGI